MHYGVQYKIYKYITCLYIVMNITLILINCMIKLNDDVNIKLTVPSNFFQKVFNTHIFYF